MLASATTSKALFEASLHEDIMGGYKEENIPEEEDGQIGEADAEAVDD